MDGYYNSAGYYSELFGNIYYDGYGYDFYYQGYGYYEYSKHPSDYYRPMQKEEYILLLYIILISMLVTFAWVIFYSMRKHSITFC